MKIFLLLVISLPLTGKAQHVYNKAKADSIFNSCFRSGEPGGSILIIKDGRTVYSNSIGLADMETKERITSKTLFNLGSISKPIVAYGILILASEGRLSIEDDLLTYFPDFKNKEVAKKVKLYHLLTHTSGLPDSRKVTEQHAFYLTARDEENFAPLKLTDSLEFEPGTKYRYSNPAFNGLALIIEQVSGMKWQEFIRSRIFEPAEMKTSTITDGPHPTSGVAHAYVEKGKGKFEELDYGEEPTFAAAGNGGVWSNVEELWALEQAIQGNKFLSPEWTGRSRTIYPLPNWADSNVSRLGVSWFITREMNKKMIGHTGSQGGFVSDYVWIPELKVFYVLLCNTPRQVEALRRNMLECFM